MEKLKALVSQGTARYRRIHGRDRFLLAAGSSGMIHRLAATALGFVTTGILTRLLGRDLFGVWATLSVLPQWVALADLGIGQSLSTKLGRLFGENDHRSSRLLIWSAFWTQLLMALAFSAVIYLTTLHLDVSRLFSGMPPVEKSELNSALLWLALGTVLTLPFRNYGNILMARQRPIDSAALGIFGSAAMLAITLAASYASAGISGYSAAFTLTSFATCVVGLTWLFRFRAPELWKPFEVDWKEGGNLTKVGLVFFFGGITWTINSTFDSMMLAKLVGPGAVTDFNLTLKLFGLTGLLTSVAGTGLSSAYAEAFGRRDLAWIKSRYSFTLKIAVSSGLAISLVVGLMAPWVIDFWSGGAAKPSIAMIASFVFWFAVFPVNQMIAFALAGLNRPKEMLYIGIFTTVINVPLTFVLILTFGESGAALGMGAALLIAGVFYAHRKIMASLRSMEGQFSA